MIPYTRKGELILQYNLYDHIFKKKIIENNENANLFEQVRNSIFFLNPDYTCTREKYIEYIFMPMSVSNNVMKY
jgi:hypothetical protein